MRCDAHPRHGLRCNSAWSAGSAWPAVRDEHTSVCRPAGCPNPAGPDPWPADGSPAGSHADRFPPEVSAGRSREPGRCRAGSAPHTARNPVPAWIRLVTARTLERRTLDRPRAHEAADLRCPSPAGPGPWRADGSPAGSHADRFPPVAESGAEQNLIAPCATEYLRTARYPVLVAVGVVTRRTGKRRYCSLRRRAAENGLSAAGQPLDTPALRP